MVNLKFSVNAQVGDKNGRILILDVNIDEIRYVLVKMYDAKSELSKLIKNFSEENRIVLAGDLNAFFDSKLETKRGNLC